MTNRVNNNIASWGVFLISITTYILTVEPTTSFWDCGEYIATAYKLQVGHPPGAPLFLLLGNLFSQFSFGNVENVALMINLMSVLFSALTIVLLFWTIKLFIIKIANNSPNHIINISAAVGALIYAFSDSFWFSAVEGEVYAMSSFFTALVFWAIMKWEQAEHLGYKANKWLIFIAYLIGLSIGVHLLSLLVIPAIVLIYYFKRFHYKGNIAGFLAANAVAILLLGIIYNGIIPQFVNIAGKLEIFFVNSLSLPFNSGTIFYFTLVISSIICGLIISKKNKLYNTHTIILAFAVFLIGYTSFFTLIIRSNANTPIDENSPEDAVSLLSYLNREQYGTSPLLYGQYFNTEVTSYKDGNPVWVKDKKRNKYIISDDRKNSIPVYDEKTSGFFPRIWSSDKRHVEGYQNWADLKSTTKRPTFSENIKFFFNYQINHMYARYFMWNFAGKQNDKQGHGELNNGNWISGINFIDNIRLGPQYNIPEHLKNNPGRNTYYFLPLILGLIGLLYHYKQSPEGTWTVFLLFIFTGLAIAIELNQTPFQPRERDYAYVGSFYAFAIWIGMGTIALYQTLETHITSNKATLLIISLSMLFVPGLMATEGWDDHNRSNRYTATAFAKNYLRSCEPNAILFTMGDNDTFPLWYVQEVEGFRTDVRIVNLSLLNTDWYIDQMKRDAYDGKAVPFSLNRDQYKQGTRDVAIYIDKGVNEKRLSLSDFNRWIKSDNQQTKINIGKDYDFFYTQKIRIPVSEKEREKYQSYNTQAYIDIDLKTRQLEKKDLMILDLIESNNWERPIYFAITIGSSGRSFLYLDKYFRLDGMAYKLTPINYSETVLLEEGDMGGINTNILYNILMEQYEWGNLNSDIYLDETNLRMTMNFRNNFSRLAKQLIIENKLDSAKLALDKCMSLMPENQVPLNYFVHPIIESYYQIKDIKTANTLVTQLSHLYYSELDYYLNFNSTDITGVISDIYKNLQFYNQLIEMTREYNTNDEVVPILNEMEAQFNSSYQKFLQISM
jgi:hypothetical protein